MAKNKRSEFKKWPYIQFFGSDWLNDASLKLLPPGAKGFWIDLIALMSTQCFPYGHCALLSHKKLREATKKGKKIGNLRDFSVEVLVNQNSNQGVDSEVDLKVELSLHLPVAEQLLLSDNIEEKLSTLLPYTPDQVKEFVQQLEDGGVCARTPDGIIYSKRLVRDFHKRIVAFKNGGKGGNPNLKKGNNGAGQGSAKDRNLVNQNPNLVLGNGNGNENDSSNPTLLESQQGMGSGLKERGVGETHEGEGKGIDVDATYNRSNAELLHFRNYKHLTPADLDRWREFVEFVRQEPYRELLKARFVDPADFTRIVKQNKFSKDRWGPVIEKLLSSGIQPQQNLNFRIPQFLGYLYAPPKGKAGAGNMDTGGSDFSGQNGW